MGLFRTNPNEIKYTEGKKHWTDVIKNSGSGELLIWRQPEEDFNTNSTLVVMPGEQAIFINQGVIEQVFDNGTYKLSTENYPFIGRLRNAFSGGISTFNCVVYFVRKADSKEIQWGTSTPIQVRDKILGIATEVRGHGSYKVRVVNPAIFLEKMIGNNVAYQTQSDLTEYFSNQFQSAIKDALTRALNETDQELLGIESRLVEFSHLITPFVDDMLYEYGLKSVSFNVASLNIKDDELRKRYDAANLGIFEKRADAQGSKDAMNILGDDWARQQSVDIMKEMAQNPNAGVGLVGAGLGMGASIGGALGNMSNQIFGASIQSKSDPLEESKSSQEDPMETLTKLKQLLEAGLIEQTDFDAKKKEILERM